MTDPNSESPEQDESMQTKEAPLGPMEALEEQIQELRDKNLRLLAEMENQRKRLSKDKQDSTKFAVEGVICDFLGPLDNLENALGFTDQMSPETKNWAMGFQMILDQFKEILSENGISSFTSVGTQFDPHLHEAVEIEETTDIPEGKIVKEFTKGYRAGNRVVRPARVKVAKMPLPLESEPK